MRANELLDILRRRRWFLMVVIPALLGAATGVFVLFPINEVVYYFDHIKDPQEQNGVAPSLAQYVLEQLWASLRGEEPPRTLFYAFVGSVLALLSSAVFSGLQRKANRIEQLSAALGKDLTSLIAQGESDSMEFKSSFRWDLRQEKANRALEGVVLKTLAGFMNGDGGTLLVGVADDGRVLGLENDYQLLKRGDRDGFDQAIMTAVAARLGTDSCHLLHVLFHAVEEKDVCRIIAVPAPRPVYLKDNQDTKFFLRTGGGTRELSIQEAVRFISDRWRK